MQISFHGAAREVTGSCYLIETPRTRILVDAGMFQGGAFCEARNFTSYVFEPATIDAIFVSHAHLDHTGRLPQLVNNGFRGKIYLTPPTKDLTELVIRDAFHLMQGEYLKDGRPPLYEEADLERTAGYFIPMRYGAAVTIGDLTCRFHEAGHIFGSAFIEVAERSGPSAIFSGDIGNEHVPILRPTDALPPADVLVVESTYGNRLHEDESTRRTKLLQLMQTTVQQQGVLLIPAFAIERTQQLLFELHQLKEQGKIGPIDVYLDSPMAIAASQVIKAYPEYYEPEALAHVMHGEDLLQFPGLRLTPSREESKEINQAPRPKMIIAGAGMMNGGRILHHLVRYLGDPRSTVLIIGYQASGTLGAKLHRGERQVQVLGERITVRAAIAGIGAYSAHADQAKLLRWLRVAKRKPARIFCTHGEEAACVELARQFQLQLGIAAEAPMIGQQLAL